MPPIRCAACSTAVRRAGAVFCAACLAPHHVACFVSGDRCAAGGCSERFVVRPGRVRQRVRPGLVALGLVAIVAGALLRGGADAALAQQAADEEGLRLTRQAIRAEERREARALLALRVERARALLGEPRRLLVARAAAAPELVGVFAAAAIEDVRRVLAGEPELTTLDDEVAALDAEVERTFERIVALAAERRVEELVACYVHLRALMDHAAERPALRERCERWSRRLDGLGGEGFGLSLRLQLLIGDGNRCLRLMAEALRAGDRTRFEAGHAAARLVCGEMRREGREVFDRNAQALEVRARALVDRARESLPPTPER